MRETCGLRLGAGGGEGGHPSRVRDAAARVRSVGLASVFAALVALGGGAAPSLATQTRFGYSGTDAGELNGPMGVGISAQTGDVFTVEFNNYRVSRFSEEGKFQLMWGWGVNAVAPADELQVCEIECQAGYGSLQGAFGPGAPFLAGGITVDNEAASPSYGDVYVSEFGDFRVEKMTPDGKFLLMFGGEVNEGKDGTPGATEAEKDLCVAGEQCGRGVPGKANGSFEGAYQGAYIAVRAGRVYVGDTARIEVFTEGGQFLESISLASLSSEGKVTALAMNAAGDIFFVDRGVPGVHELEPEALGGWKESAITFDSTSNYISAITLDGSGSLYVEDWSGEVSHILQYETASGQELESFGSTAAPAERGEAAGWGLAFSAARGELYESSWWDNAIWVLTPPPPGPLIINDSATPELRGAATLAGKQNPEGDETTYHFEYLPQSQYESSGGFNGATSTTPETLAAGFEDSNVEVKLPQKTLVPGTNYEVRLVASNSAGTTDGEPQLLEEIPPARVDGPWVSDVSATSATFGARINPLGAPTTYTIEYGTTTAYGQSVSGEAGNGMEYFEASFHRQDLEPSTLYHMRVVTHSEVGTVDGPDHTFTTQTARAEELALLDNRQWELVTPADKHGARIAPEISSSTIAQAAANGSSIFYLSSEPMEEEGRHRSLEELREEAGEGKGVVTPNISRHTAQGWKTRNMTLPFQIPPEASETPEIDVGIGYEREYKMLSNDLSRAMINPDGEAPPLAPGATERTPYLRNLSNGIYTPLVTCETIELTPCPKFGGETGGFGGGNTRVDFESATPDLSHVFIKSHTALTTDSSSGNSAQNLYEWTEGKLALVSVLPGGQAAEMGILGSRGDARNWVTELGPQASSSDGRWVVWGEGNFSPYLYLRDMVAKKTVQLGRKGALFEGMSTDGSRVFYLQTGPSDEEKGEEQNELYLYEPQTGTTTDLTATHGAEERSAGVQDALLGMSEDGSYVYFVATGVLANGAHAGEDNLYELHYEDSKWTTTLIADLAGWKRVPGCYSGCETIGDSRDWRDLSDGAQVSHTAYGNADVAEISPNGRYLVFMSKRSLTGYDNRDANSGEPDEEVYVYDALKGDLICASCNPSGARPIGMHDTNYEVLNGEKVFFALSPLIDTKTIWAGNETPILGQEVGTWIAADVPGWQSDEGPYPRKPRVIANDGRLFFNSADALVPQDTNGLADVYEYEPAGLGSCTTSLVTYSERASGCIDVISSGNSTAESDFYDASAVGPGGEEGEDVFFITSEKLVPADYDTTYDIYDAHECSAAAPCPVYPTTPPPCSSGDSCKAAPSPQPTLFGAPASATFKGTGNAVQGPAPHPVKQLTRAQKLRRAMKACLRKRGKRRRRCERLARQRYGPKRSRHGGASKRGRR